MRYSYEDEDLNVYKYEDKNRCFKEEEEESGCFKVVKKDVELVAMVHVKPVIKVPEHEIKVKCVGPIHLAECKKHNIKKECEFCIKQDLSLRIPIHFDAVTDVKEQGIICEHEKPCP